MPCNADMSADGADMATRWSRPRLGGIIMSPDGCGAFAHRDHRDKKYDHASIQSLVPTRVLLKMQDVYVALTCREHKDVASKGHLYAAGSSRCKALSVIFFLFIVYCSKHADQWKMNSLGLYVSFGKRSGGVSERQRAEWFALVLDRVLCGRMSTNFTCDSINSSTTTGQSALVLACKRVGAPSDTATCIY